MKLIKAVLNVVNSFELFVFNKGADMIKVLITSCDKIFGTSHLLNNVFESSYNADTHTE